MDAFYERLSRTCVEGKETKIGAVRLAAINAVRLAAIKMMKDKLYEHPFYWLASFW